MFGKVLIANRGDQPPRGGTAAQLNRVAAEGRKGGFAAGEIYVW
ncbi:MAG: hypothetical protein FD118_1725 [Rhodocyclaceae bacterium]|nr:MAG: hypothetical protein FD118_1725 [Rhodocyclaceae bacterium]